MNEWKKKNMLVLGSLLEKLDELAPRKGDQKVAISSALLMYFSVSEGMRVTFRQQVVALEADIVSEWMSRVLGIQATPHRDMRHLEEEILEQIGRGEVRADEGDEQGRAKRKKPPAKRGARGRRR